MIQQIILHKKYAPEKTSKTYLVGSDAKNALPSSNIYGINAKDLMGLSWIFAKEDDFDIC